MWSDRSWLVFLMLCPFPFIFPKGGWIWGSAVQCIRWCDHFSENCRSVEEEYNPIVPLCCFWVIYSWKGERNSSPFPLTPYFIKVFLGEINGHCSAKDDSLHKDDTELISEMLQNWLFDVCCETWIIKILLKPLEWLTPEYYLWWLIWLSHYNRSQIASDKIAFHSPLNFLAISFFCSLRVQSLPLYCDSCLNLLY